VVSDGRKPPTDDGHAVAGQAKYTAPPVLGKFHEISVETPDIAESVAFYERLGFTQVGTTDTWQHPYGVLTDGKLFLGLHQFKFPSPTITYVHADVAGHAHVIEKHGVELAWKRVGEDAYNEVGFFDPSGQPVRVQEAATHFASDRERGDASLCGDFAEFSLPAAEFPAMREFWEPLGFVALGESDAPYLRMSMTSDHIDLAVHRPRTLDAPMLVFVAADMGERIERLRSLGFELSEDLPRGLDPRHSALISAPEGTALLLVNSIE
jgi:catechol 2,3-dioxygenase-like lactoylglutathione lyase family enzyme